MLVGPIDLTITALLIVRRFGLARTLFLVLFLAPLWLHALPPQDCSSMRPLFRRCEASRWPARLVVTPDPLGPEGSAPAGSFATQSGFRVTVERTSPPSIRGGGDAEQLDDRTDLADRRSVLELLRLEEHDQTVDAHRLR